MSVTLAADRVKRKRRNSCADRLGRHAFEGNRRRGRSGVKQRSPDDDAFGGVVTKMVSQFAGPVRLMASLVGLAMLLSGCGMSSVGLLSSSGFSDISSEKSSDDSVTEETLLDSAKADYASGPVLSTVGTSCPKFVVWPRDRRVTIYEPGQEGDGLAIRHRGRLHGPRANARSSRARSTSNTAWPAASCSGRKASPAPSHFRSRSM